MINLSRVSNFARFKGSLLVKDVFFEHKIFNAKMLTTSNSDDFLSFSRKLFPALSNLLRKGDCGRIGVIGGSEDYTGAPYFASMTTIRMGADLCYVFAHPHAAPVLKTYSPELMVHPNQDFSEIKERLSRLHVIVFGPGIGRRADAIVPLFRSVLELLRKNPHLGMVVDADGLYFVSTSEECRNELRSGLSNQVILTPNLREFEHIYAQTPMAGETKTNGQVRNDVGERVRRLAEYLRVCVLLKSDVDIISDGQAVRYGPVPGSLRRCGGQGDILSGATALFAHWSRLAGLDPSEALNVDLCASNLMDGARAASDFVRSTAARTFARYGRSMTATDIVAEIPEVVRVEIDGKRTR